MTLADWASETRDRFQDEPAPQATTESLLALNRGLVRRVGRAIPNYGRQIYRHDWDLCIVLDACRPDALEAVSDGYDWLPADIPTAISSGHCSRKWIASNFGPEWAAEKSSTAHVTWNAFSDYELEGDNWLYLDEVWRDVWDEDRGVLPPRAITERAIAAGRKTDPDRLLVHYMQPHAPYPSLSGNDGLSHEEVGEIAAGRRTVWNRIREGEVSKQQAWEAYLDTLRWVLDDVEELLQNTDAENVLLTADHGEAFGQFGFLGHPTEVPLLATKRVPWVCLGSCSDRQTISPETHTSSTVTPNVEERLKELGYR